MCLCRLPFDLFPYYSNPLIPDLATFHHRTSQTVALLHWLGSPDASSNVNEKTALLSSPQVLKVVKFFTVVSGAQPPSPFPEPASASLCYWTSFCFLQVWRNQKLVCGNYCACFPLSCLSSPSLRTFTYPSSLSCIFSRLGRNRFSSPDPKMKWKQVQGMKYSWAAGRLMIYLYTANFWRCKYLTKLAVSFVMQSSLFPCPRHIWGQYVSSTCSLPCHVPHSLEGRWLRYWQCWIRAGGLHRHTLDTLQSISTSINLYWGAACSDCLTEKEKHCGNTEISHLV